MNVEDRIAALIAPSLGDMGYVLVRVALMGRTHRTLQIMAERVDDAPMTVDDCEQISRAVSALLDVDDPISEAYDLEVSSPGIDRPLTKPQDYVRFSGLVAKLETKMPVNGQKRFKGRVFGDDEGRTVRLLLESGEEVSILFDNIVRAKLVLNDELLALAAGDQIN